MALTDLQSMVQRLTRADSSEILAEDIDAAIQTSVLRYSELTQPCVVTATQDTLPERGREAVAVYAAAHLLEQLAIAKSGDIDPSIGAAAAGRSTPAQEYAARSKALFARYRELLGIRAERTPPAGGVVCLGAGRAGLTHPGWWS
ncbi:MAG: hypothetical protein HQM01_11930 [Magnetococcales bacterium]|nr:hypothetical protein [Magnetococcales bacterium]